MSTINENSQLKFDWRYTKLTYGWKSTLRHGHKIISDARLPHPITAYITDEMDFTDWAYTILTTKDRRHLSYHINRMSLDKMVFDSLKKEIDIEERNSDLHMSSIDVAIDDISEELFDVEEELYGLESHLEWLEKKSDESLEVLDGWLEIRDGKILYSIYLVEKDIAALKPQQSLVNSQLKSLQKLKADAVRDKKLHVGKARALYMLAKYAYATFGACVQYGLDQEDADKAKAEDLVNEFISMQREYHRADSCSSDDKIEKIQKYEKIINNKHTFSTAAEKLMGKGSGCDVCWG